MQMSCPWSPKYLNGRTNLKHRSVLCLPLQPDDDDDDLSELCGETVQYAEGSKEVFRTIVATSARIWVEAAHIDINMTKALT